MKHIPHLVVAAPWSGDSLGLSVMQWRHLTRVLKVNRGDTVTYTDGLGTLGEGILGGNEIERGEERFVDRPTNLIVAVAPPATKDRQRYLIEKLSEIGVERLVWLKTAHGKNRVAAPAKVFSWVLSAVEQSRGVWLMETGEDLVTWSDLEEPVVVCHPGGSADSPYARTVVIGPEGGFADDELGSDIEKWDLGPTILRVETAAVVAAARLSI